MARKPSVLDYDFDYRKLRARMYEHRLFTGEDQLAFSTLLGITVNALDMKLRGTSPFTIYEIALLRDKLKLTNEEVGMFFFTPLPKRQELDVSKL